ncbi:MAG: alcohol dehydrogenase catalytic domain-containing protein [Oscillospiraceae bacterium]|jgi:L-iditol 2-dehydrogenase|nr:alcohol dehydrogenase catalytic domain-containing protein [Oscillospiraceae bacterium]MCI1991523.1 alcohol dehydrogenase catalytic domain-containing protein [Oscillospiraceae bacterium]MCI2034429.1 alcohol dehydrogenase catalytic domain-containing protein [Oscillospiraceae bacterium]
MKAAVVEKIRAAKVTEVPDPVVIPASLKIKVEACAVCGSDLRIFTKGDPRATFPRIIGHEIAGTVVETSPELAGYRVGERVTVAPGHGCGKCKYCRNGMGNVCIHPRPSVGYASSGGFAQYIVPPVNVVANGFVNPIPDNLTFEQASMAELLACCINGQERAQVGEGDTVLIIGAGPAGCMHIQLARARGASKVLVANRSPRRLRMAAERFHPDAAFCGEGDALVQKVLAETDGLGADVVIVAAPSHEAQENALRMVAPRGRVNLFGGLPKDNCISHLETNIIHYKECMLTGASSSLGRQNREALRLLSENKVEPMKYITHRFTLDEFGDAFAAVERHDTIKAVVFPWKTKREILEIGKSE